MKKLDTITNGLNDTLDLKAVYAKEYLENTGYNVYKNIDIMEKFMYKFKKISKFLIICGVCYVLWGLIGIYTSHADYNEHGRFLARFPTEKTVIGCYNSYTKETREGNYCNKPGDKNIMLPPRSQITQWLKYYNEYQIMNRLALVNFESGFDENAQNPSAKGYVQTLRSHKVAPDINSQLAWMKNRETKTYAKRFYAGKYGKVRGCGYYWDNYNYKDGFAAGEYGVLSCMYRYHYDANKGTWYAKKGITVTKFYKNYLWGTK